MIMGASLLASTTAFSQSTGNEGKFTIHNQIDNNVVVGFYTNDGSGWSANWLAEQLTPGEQANARFDAETGACAQTFKVGSLSDTGGEVLDDPISINICKASNIYVADNEIYYD